MAELYAQKLDISDDRIKTASIAEPTFTVSAYAESGALFTKDDGVVIAGKKADLYDSFKAGKITEEQYNLSLSGLVGMSTKELSQREDEAADLSLSGLTPDDKASGEIIEKIAFDRKEEKVDEAAKVKYYARNYFDHLVRSARVKLVVRDPSITKEKEKELDRRTQAIKNLNSNFIEKYSNTKTFADRMLSISADVSAKKLAAPAEQAKEYQYEGK
tara:strand:- start:3 stop:650 length:648 start_codon:yes stop_codon:yes gene_type:complete